MPTKILIHHKGTFFKEPFTLEKDIKGKGFKQLRQIKKVLRCITSQVDSKIINYEIEIK